MSHAPKHCPECGHATCVNWARFAHCSMCGWWADDRDYDDDMDDGEGEGEWGFECNVCGEAFGDCRCEGGPSPVGYG